MGNIKNNYRGATIPERGIIVGKGVKTSGLIKGQALLQHEYGHILQYRLIGPRAYYSVVVPESFSSALFSSSKVHDNYWTETWANYLSKKYFGAKWLGSVVKGYPAQDISRHNALKIILANSYSSNYTQFY